MPHRYDIWAPRPERLQLWTRQGDAEPRLLDMARDAETDWWMPVDLPEDLVGVDIDYGFLVDDHTTPLPDPRSLSQPEGVHGPSRTFDLSAHQWADQDWNGRQLAGSSIYELHVGTFTTGPDGRGGTLDSAIERLDHLVELGITHVEPMPVNAFNGHHGWGYDGVGWFAVHPAYGGPAAYQRFVDACHARGLAVIQDVVYNHFGPSGNYLPTFAPYLHAAATPWGDAINLDGEDSDEVRRYIIDNVMMWIKDFHVDGLRLDAVHALVDNRAIHILEEIATEVDAVSAFVGRPISLIAESDLNDPRLITPREASGYGLGAQWNDDFHHAVLANLTGTERGYYVDFKSFDALSKVFETGWYHDGTRSTFRGRSHGRPLDVSRTPGWRLVVCSDNHDQIGNRAAGERLSTWLSTDELAIAAALVLTSPYTPMIFMGEEWGADTPFTFFTSHPEDDLADAVRAGRMEEFQKMDWDQATIPDPQGEATFTSSMLNWDEPDKPQHRELLDWYKSLLQLRQQVPALLDPRLDLVVTRWEHGQPWFMVERGERDANALVVANFDSVPTRVPVGQTDWQVALGRGVEGLDDGHLALAGHGVAVLVAPESDTRGGVLE